MLRIAINSHVQSSVTASLSTTSLSSTFISTPQARPLTPQGMLSSASCSSCSHHTYCAPTAARPPVVLPHRPIRVLQLEGCLVDRHVCRSAHDAGMGIGVAPALRHERHCVPIALAHHPVSGVELKTVLEALGLYARLYFADAADAIGTELMLWLLSLAYLRHDAFSYTGPRCTPGRAVGLYRVEPAGAMMGLTACLNCLRW